MCVTAVSFTLIPWDVSDRRTITDSDLSKDGCLGLSGAMKHLFVRFPAGTIAEIGCALAVRDGRVFRAPDNRDAANGSDECPSVPRCR